jgi:hypothetical protein
MDIKVVRKQLTFRTNGMHFAVKIDGLEYEFYVETLEIEGFHLIQKVKQTYAYERYCPHKLSRNQIKAVREVIKKKFKKLVED